MNPLIINETNTSITQLPVFTSSDKYYVRTERPGREIKIDDSFLNNKEISVKIGTVEDKNCPNTVYISLTFWVDIKNRFELMGYYGEMFDYMISRDYSRELNNIYRVHLRDCLSNNFYFPYYSENIFTYDFPDNLNYNDKKSFTSIELALHTTNCQKGVNDKSFYPLNNKRNTELFDELLKISKIIVQTDLLLGKGNFSISKRK